jgi:hypothetical protein
MLRGRFSRATGRPFIDGHLFLPRLDIHGNISFCIDTGADRSLLLPTDGERLGIEFEMLARTERATGIGGVSENFVEGAIIAFPEPGRCLWIYETELAIAARRPELFAVPSLLGRDIVNRWRMVYDPAADRLTLTVKSADARIAL